MIFLSCEVAFDNSGTLYKIVYSASPELFDSYFPVAKNMIESFSLPVNNAPPGVPTPSQGPNNFQPNPSPLILLRIFLQII